ncbi:CPBP family intramembrane glutamic endopeptidase [Streptomyces sp. NPDC002845]
MPSTINAGHTTRAIPQYSLARVLAVWAAAAAPMALLAWVVAPAAAGPDPTANRFAVTLIIALTAGLIWQFVLVLLLVGKEQGSLRWSVVREALWLRAPSDHKGRRGGRLWWWTVPFILVLVARQFATSGLPAPSNRDFGEILSSPSGQDLIRGDWALFVLILVMLLFNTVLGEELLFRGLLLPRMSGVFGRADWAANGVLMGLYHLHQPWGIPLSIIGGLLFAYPTKRFRSAWMGIIVHSTNSVVIAVLVFLLVIS